MKNDYPLFDDSEVKAKYVREIEDIFYKNNLNWCASPSDIKPQINVTPKGDSRLSKFPNVFRIGVGTTDRGIANLVIIGMPSMRTSDSKELIEKKGYTYEVPKCNGSCYLSKSLEDLESLALELRDIEPILLLK